MSDFLYLSSRAADGELSGHLRSIYLDRPVETMEYHGGWGSLAVTRSRYNGFDPLEDEKHICVVVGGPLLRFRDNHFLTGSDRQAGTGAILDLWLRGSVDWSTALSGPFVVLVIDKQTGSVTCITDRMMFLPVYRFSNRHMTGLSTHVDVLARACAQEDLLDEVSLIDFILHYTVTFPYTVYENIRQCDPATVHALNRRPGEAVSLDTHGPYWQPTETRLFKSLRDAAAALREGMVAEIDDVTASMERVAQFISGGEDSRVLAGMLPARLQRDGYIFLDSMNLEGRIAAQAASAYGVRFKPAFRKPLHYLSILPEASALIGTGHQFIHAHSLGFDETQALHSYPAVFGGYGADVLLKGLYVPKIPLARYGFVPEVGLSREWQHRDVSNPVFPEELLAELTERRRRHLALVRSVRPTSAVEWFGLWPMTMRIAVPNVYCNRRLFASYEPFLSNVALDVSAGVPISWKLNRRLFVQAFRPFLRPTRFLRHASGRYPYYPWWVNWPIQSGTALRRLLSALARRTRHNDGPWNDWEAEAATAEWRDAVQNATDNIADVRVLHDAIKKGAFEGGTLNVYQKVNLLQTCFQLGNARSRSMASHARVELAG